MIQPIEVKSGIRLEDYNLYATLAIGLRELNAEAATQVPKINSSKLWFVNSTSRGGGVAEMLPREINLLRQLGLDCEWIVASADHSGFFAFTKKIHNLIHGTGEHIITREEQEQYEQVSRDNAAEFDKLVKPGDIVVIHDPQPMGMASFMKTGGLKFIWRCHIGTDEQNLQTASAWSFLQKYAGPFLKAVFSATEYIPSYLTGKASVIRPSIDPLAHKNRELSINELVGILCNADLLTQYHEVLTPPFSHTAKKLQPDGTFQSPLLSSDMGLLFKPTIVQVSRWDKLKGFLPLMKGYEELRTHPALYAGDDARNKKRIELSHLILAGPDPGFVADDPEGKEILEELARFYCALPPAVQEHISIIELPMQSREENDLIVNALQRAATIVMQNSIKEGFGLTITEAMWKTKPVIGTNVVGIRQQLKDDIDGLLIENPEDPKEIASKIASALNEEKSRNVWAHNAQKKVIDQFLIFTSLREWLQLFALLE